MDKFTPLSAEQVWQIADPVITLDTLEVIGEPAVKKDLEARLAIELNRQITSTQGAEKKRLRKLLKRLLNDKMTKEEKIEQLKLSTRLTGMKIKNIDDPIIKRDINRAKARLAEAEAAKVARDKLYAKNKANYDKYMALSTVEKGKVTKINNPDAAKPKQARAYEDELLQEQVDKLRKLESKLLKKGDLIAQVREDGAKIPELEGDLTDLEQSIANTTLRQQEIDDEQKIAMDENINPAAFEKSLNERIAESNALFQNMINAGRKPHITIPFDQLMTYDDINSVFMEQTTGRISNSVLIIYRSSELFGHWVCLCRSNDLRRISYFNSYGSYIDKALDHISQEFKDQSRQNFPYLLKLLHQSAYEIHWNDTQLQVMDNKTATCGHWCGLFMYYSKMGKTLEEFVLPFESVPLEERDDLIVRMTQPYLEG